MTEPDFRNPNPRHPKEGRNPKAEFRFRSAPGKVHRTPHRSASSSGFRPSDFFRCSDFEHRVDAQLFRVGNLRLERRGAEIGIHAHHVRAQFVHDGLGVINQRRVVIKRDDAHLVGREPEREVARVMLDEKTDEPLVRAERRAMDAAGRRALFIRSALQAARSGRVICAAGCVNSRV